MAHVENGIRRLGVGMAGWEQRTGFSANGVRK